VPSCRQRTPGGAPAVELEALDQAAGLQPQVGPPERRLQESARRRPAPAALLVDVEITRAFVVAGVEIVDRLDAALLGGDAEGFQEVPAHALALDPPFAAGRMRIAVPQEVMLMPLEIGQHVVPTPAAEAELAPMVVIGRLPAHIDHRIDGRGAADHLAARIVEACGR